MPNNPYDKKHLKNLDKYIAQVKKSYVNIINQIAKLSGKGVLNSEKEFYFKDNKNISKEVDKLLKELFNDVYGTTVSGINSEWDLAVEKNNKTAETIYGTGLKDLPVRYLSKYLSNNAKARQNFVERKINGLGLSDRIWNNTKQLKAEMELALELSIGKGKSAAYIAKEIKQYLNDPDKLFRRVRDEKGVLRLSKAAKAYHPGQGKYRSSYKNAVRVTRNETNFSYEGSNTAKRKQQDFVVGLQIKTSPQHSPEDDKGGISCTALQGIYPKDFDFTYKWHVNCKCYTLTVLKTREELDKDLDLILKGEAPSTPSANEVKGLPNNYTGYLKENKKKFENWKTPPRTFENNKKVK